MIPIHKQHSVGAGQGEIQSEATERQPSPEGASKTQEAATGVVAPASGKEAAVTKIDRSKIAPSSGGYSGGEVVAVARRGLFSTIAEFFKSLFRPKGMISSQKIRELAVAKVRNQEAQSSGLKIGDMVRPFQSEFQECNGKHLTHAALGKDIWRYLTTDSILWNGKVPSGNTTDEKLVDLLGKVASLAIKDEAKRAQFMKDVAELSEEIQGNSNAAELVEKFVVMVDGKSSTDPELKNVMRLLFMFSQNIGVTGAIPVRIALPWAQTDDPLQKHLFTVAARADNSLDKGSVQALGIAKPEAMFNVEVSSDSSSVTLRSEVANNLQRFHGENKVTESCVTCAMEMTISLDDPAASRGTMKYVVSTPQGGIAQVSDEIEKVLRYEGVSVERR